MNFDQETADMVSANLLQIKAIKLNNSLPFTWASGLKSPIYCDNRITLSYPKIRTYIRQQLVKAITEQFGNVDVIVGVATAGIPQGALVAQELGLPFAYVRSAAKEHGLSNKIEGTINSGQTVVVIEDLVSTGKSSLEAVYALRETGAKVAGMAAIFSYGLQIAAENFKAADCRLVTLSDYDSMISKAVEDEYISKKDEVSLREWRQDPKAWSDRHQ
ncbi:MAG: orotate phosphoribosyltransferase [Bacteroidetes bacterium CG18_big_fil_WC_8_21_14_2_50_41_14]|nr:MAG: orotate phosphoribosyltransferase [Bacteroidetes bacterium CG18_big_fil_WC_8_21_14_2_50_41_14]